MHNTRDANGTPSSALDCRSPGPSLASTSKVVKRHGPATDMQAKSVVMENTSSTRAREDGTSAQPEEPQQKEGKSDEDPGLLTVTHGEVIINMIHTGQDAWDSDASSTSTTSTPDYKRGRHQEDPLTQRAVQELLQPDTQIPVNVSGTAVCRPLSLHLLADSRLANWPKKDNVCIMDYHAGWSFQEWIAALRAEVIRVKSNTVVIYFEKTQDYQDVIPVKNSLHTICKVIRQHNHAIHIFIANFLPKASTSPLRKGEPENTANFILLQAVRSINSAINITHPPTLWE